ncbi:hypothetical protein SAY87_023573 [Trapa incisa]|uniref:SHSP domain-containing protein n=1 Tax=Trapa incisa TaxID=236973 RepID=A0AAN7L6Y1_9MYRT|nr:hypothetical protein SAY87_023573 [Trapa incisa]
MANLIRSKKVFKTRSRSRSNNDTVEELNPSWDWGEDSGNHYIRINLPDFKKDDIKIQAVGHDEVTISGERRVKDKFVYFEKKYKVPENADNQSFSWKLEDGILTVNIPKRPITEENINGSPPDQAEKAMGASDTHADEKASHEMSPIRTETKTETVETKEEKNGAVQNGKESCRAERSGYQFTRWIVQAIENNKLVIITAIVAFSMGVFTSRKIY